MGQAARVLVADDHPLIREGLGMAVRGAQPGAVIDNAGSIGEAEAAIQRYRYYRLVLLDFVLPDARGFSGFLLLQHMLGPGVPIAIITAREDPTLVEAARALGAAGFLSKSKPIDETTAALRTIMAGGMVFPPVPTQRIGSQSVRERIATLSGAQLRVLLALADGRLNKQIAGDLEVSEATVKTHLTAVFKKLGVINRAQALLAVQPLLADFVGSEPLTD
jgi:DNA-binding NarL/FixJ family response regulator